MGEKETERGKLLKFSKSIHKRNYYVFIAQKIFICHFCQICIWLCEYRVEWPKYLTSENSAYRRIIVIIANIWEGNPEKKGLCEYV